MAKCEFVETIPGEEFHCPNCDLYAYTSSLPMRDDCEGVSTHSHTYRKPTPQPKPRRQIVPAVHKEPIPLAPCIHRGGLLRMQPCKPCQGAGKLGLDVYACPIHKECTEHNSGMRPRIQGCATCDDYSPNPEFPAQT